jgi:hypothetical protein
MFGMIGYYRGDNIFAALPRTRSVGTPNSFIFKLKKASSIVVKNARQDSRVSVPETPGAAWYSFELASAADLRGALSWLQKAYNSAR